MVTGPEEKREQQRLQHLVGSITIGVVINVALGIALSLLALKRPSLQFEEDFSVTTESSEVTTDEPDRPSSSAGTQPLEINSSEIAITADAMSRMALPAASISLAEGDLSSSSGRFGIGSGWVGHGFKVGIGNQFEGMRLGDGSNLALFLDISGSMRKHSERTAAFVRRYYPQSEITEIKGCSIHHKHGLVKELTSNPIYERRGKIVFVCDMQDTVTTEGVKALELFLIQRNFVRELHIISYDRSPKLSIARLIQITRGSFQKAIVPKR